VAVALTSNLKFKNQYCIEIDDYNLEAGSLPQKSQIRCDKIYTLSKTIIVKRFHKINKDTYELIRHKLSELVT
jgi:mRNA interferase MazF